MAAYDDLVLSHPKLVHYWKMNDAAGAAKADSGPGAKPLTLTSAGGENTTGGPATGMGYQDLAGARSAYSTTVDLSTLGVPLTIGWWHRGTFGALGDWASSNGLMLLDSTTNLAYLAGSSVSMPVRLATVTTWRFVAMQYRQGASAVEVRMVIDGVPVTSWLLLSTLGAGASRFEVGSYAAGAGGFLGNHQISGLFIIQSVDLDAFLRTAYATVNSGGGTGYSAVVRALEPTHFWPLQANLLADVGTDLTNAGTAPTFPAGPTIAGTAYACADSAVLSLRADGQSLITSDPVSMAGWYRADAWTSDRAIIGNWTGSGAMLYISGGNIHTYVGGASLGTYAPPAVGTWHHWALTWDKVTARVYLDGSQVASYAYSSTAGAPNKMAIGTYSTQAGMDAAAAFMAWWSGRALTAAEVAALAAGDLQRAVRSSPRSGVVTG